MKKLSALVLALLLSLSLLTGCGSDSADAGAAGQRNSSASDEPIVQTAQPEAPDAQIPPPAEAPDTSSPSGGNGNQAQTETPAVPSGAAAFSLNSVPEYAGKAYVAVNGNSPYFDTSALTPVSVEEYSPLDNLRRCGVAYACIGKDI